MEIQPKLCPMKFCSPVYAYDENKPVPEGCLCDLDACAWWVASSRICGIIFGALKTNDQ